MTEEPMDEAFNEIKRILKLLDQTKNAETNTNLHAELAGKLRDIEEQIAAFALASDQILFDAGASKQELDSFLEEEPKGLSPKDLEAWRIANSLRVKALKEHDAFRESQGLEGGEETLDKKIQAQSSKESKISEKHKHMKKYKRLGGNKDWKPL
jgi:hypothetical protein